MRLLHFIIFTLLVVVAVVVLPWMLSLPLVVLASAASGWVVPGALAFLWVDSIASPASIGAPYLPYSLFLIFVVCMVVWFVLRKRLRI